MPGAASRVSSHELQEGPLRACQRLMARWASRGIGGLVRLFVSQKDKQAGQLGPGLERDGSEPAGVDPEGQGAADGSDADEVHHQADPPRRAGSLKPGVDVSHLRDPGAAGEGHPVGPAPGRTGGSGGELHADRPRAGHVARSGTRLHQIRPGR